ncbi:XRE family transcriptional regulator [Nocardia brasiliensis]|uniref:XRE family transcriptional regulator n=1 Tax=Nocardia brasiliensis TaxID=37326 RepID=A0A6G9XRA8_NOCBR|nr:XRE family transcriptional regulator [Nocardia brasiliensis]QIS03363.1 XRE family transcriptional regulator [Nocardia brasiliensis]
MLEAMERAEEGGPALSSTDLPEPGGAGSPKEFIAALRLLKAWSGLAYRQLEGKAAASGDVLPSSTIATTLGRDTLPRERFVIAFTRACGLDGDQIKKWLDVRRYLAMRVQSPIRVVTESVPADEPDPPAEPTKAERRKHVSVWMYLIGLTVAAVIGIAGTLAVQYWVLHTHDDTVPTVSQPLPGLALADVGSWVRIQPARTPELCLAEGRDRTQRYPTAIAAQRVCSSSSPRVYLDPIDEGTVQIQWHHSRYGIGCLTVLTGGPGDNLLEPRDDCSDDNPAQQFRIEPTGPASAARFRIRTTATNHCLALRGQDTADGAEIVQGRCSGARDQEFLIHLIPPA